jgi:hypothetical protein
MSPLTWTPRRLRLALLGSATLICILIGSRRHAPSACNMPRHRNRSRLRRWTVPASEQAGSVAKSPQDVPSALPAPASLELPRGTWLDRGYLPVRQASSNRARAAHICQISSSRIPPRPIRFVARAARRVHHAKSNGLSAMVQFPATSLVVSCGLLGEGRFCRNRQNLGSGGEGHGLAAHLGHDRFERGLRPTQAAPNGHCVAPAVERSGCRARGAMTGCCGKSFTGPGGGHAG